MFEFGVYRFVILGFIVSVRLKTMCLDYLRMGLVSLLFCTNYFDWCFVILVCCLTVLELMWILVDGLDVL